MDENGWPDMVRGFSSFRRNAPLNTHANKASKR
jgi:hypothetical protein